MKSTDLNNIMKPKLQSVIVEDLPLAAEFLQHFCQQSGRVEVLGVFASVSDALNFLNQHKVDLIFLDIELSGSTGFELMDGLTYSPHIILTTSKTEYAYDAFQYNVDDFLKKPFSYKRFLEALEKLDVALENAGKETKASADYIFIKVDHRLIKLQADQILFIESMGDYVRFVTPERKLMNLNTMKSLEERLDPKVFVKVHRSYIVNISKIDDVQGNTIYLDKHEVPIGKAHREELLQRLNVL